MSTANSSTGSNNGAITTFLASDAVAFFNRGPILTPFIPPTTCLSTLTRGNTFYYVGNINGDGIYVDSSCYPSGISRSIPGMDPWRVYYYSPAVCPQGWSRAATVTSSFGVSGVQLSLGTDTTAVVCCPQGFFYLGYDRKCGSKLFPSSTIVYFSPSLDTDGAWSSTTDTSTLVISGTTPITVSANGVPVWAQASDAVRFASAALEAASTSSSKTITTQPAKPSIYTTSIVPTSTAATSTSGPHLNSNSLSTGTKIAIGIVIPFFILVIASVIAIYLIRIRKSRLSKQKNDTSTLSSNTVPISQSRQFHYHKPELDAQTATISELHTDTPESSELPTVAIMTPVNGRITAVTAVI